MTRRPTTGSTGMNKNVAIQQRSMRRVLQSSICKWCLTIRLLLLVLNGKSRIYFVNRWSTQSFPLLSLPFPRLKQQQPTLHLINRSRFGTTTKRSRSKIFQQQIQPTDALQEREGFAEQRKLRNVVCLVTGASRGIGKGIALELGAQGAIVYVTGTTTGTSSFMSGNVEETIEQTAYEINQLGGVGIPIRCDHSVDVDVQKVIQTIENEYGYLDILVNNAFRFPSNVPGGRGSSPMEFLLQRKFYEQGAWAWDTIHTVGLRSHYITTCYAMKLLFTSRRRLRAMQQQQQYIPIARPLIIMISSFGGLTYSFNVAYGVGKAGVDRMVKDMSYELQDDDICVLSLYPGVVNTERTQRSVQNGEWDKYVQLSLDMAESARFTGRAIVALASDPNNIRKSGTVQVVAECATEYQFTDIDGTIPPSIRSLRFLLYNYLFTKNPLLQKWNISMNSIPDIRIPFWMMSMGRPPPPKQ